MAAAVETTPSLLDDYLRQLGIAPEDWSGWKAEVAQRDGKDVAVVMTKGCEIHFVSLGGPAMTRKNTLQFLKPIYDKFGYITTRVPLTVEDHKLRNVLGFVPTWGDDRFSYWMLYELPFSRRTP